MTQHKIHPRLVKSAIALLLKQPRLAMWGNVDALLDMDGPELLLLQELVKLIRARPESTTITLLNHFAGTPEGKILSTLEKWELIIPIGSIDDQFIGAINALQRGISLNEMADKLRQTDYASLNETERDELRDLLHEKLMREKVNQGFA